MSKFYPPAFGEPEFHCFHCGVYAEQNWEGLYYPGNYVAPFSYSECEHCKKLCYWYLRQMIVPSFVPVPPPHEHFPEICLEDYNEAREVFALSPRAATALLRLCVQKLMVELGEKGESISEDIASLVQKGLPEEIQRTLDYCRVVGNHAVHPGEIRIEEEPEVAHCIFEMLNLIVEERIARPKRIADRHNVLYFRK